MNKIIVNSDVLFNALQIVKRVLDARPIFPIIGNFLFDVNNGKLFISGTDLHNTLRLAFSCDYTKTDAQTNFQAVVPVSILKYLQKIEHQPLTLEYDADKKILLVIEEDGKAKYTCDDVDVYPKTPQTDKETLPNFTSSMLDEFKDLLRYASDDVTRPALSGIGFMNHANKFYFAATDAHILKVVQVPDLDSDRVNDWFILRSKAAKILSEFSFKKEKVEQQIRVAVKSKINDVTEKETIEYVSFSFTYEPFEVEITSKAIDERYPAIFKVIPEESTTKVTVSKNTVVKLLDKCLLFANKTTHLIRMTIDGKVSLNARDFDFEQEFNTDISGAITNGNVLEIGFNAELLQSVVKSFNEEITLEMTAANKPVVIRDGNSLSLCMPLMLSEYA